MKTIYYRRWEPARSSVKVEFRPEVLQEMRSANRREDARGFLFGKREGDVVRVVSAGVEPREELDTLGVYIARIRGEVFLTDDDLEHVENVKDGIALVMAGRRAGFFTREADGSIQAVRSHEEFVVMEPPPEASASAPPIRNQRHPWIPPVKMWKRLVIAAAVFAGTAAAMSSFYGRMMLPKLDVTLRAANGQLILGWDRAAVASGAAYLEIREGDVSSRTPLAVDSSGATYFPKTDHVDVWLSSGDRTGMAQWTAPYYARQF
jgi:hypothetical protein